MIRKFVSLIALVTASMLPVQAATVNGIVRQTDSTGSAVSGAIVTLSQGGGGGGSTALRDTTDLTGAFSFNDVKIGNRQLRASKDGFQNSTQTAISIADSLATYTKNLILLPIQYSSISGTVTDSTEGTTISGARVILRMSTGGGAAIDTETTDATGKYQFTKAQSGSSYTINVSATGFVTKTSSAIQLTGTTPGTIDIKLNKVILGSITGKITGDSLKGTIIAGARVILSRMGGGGMGGAIDTVVSGADGVYLFENISSGQGYSITASSTGYNNTSSNLNNKKAGVDTVNIVLSKPGTGNLFVIVKKRSDSSGIAGASIVAVPSGYTGGTTLTGITGSTGSIEFEQIAIVNTSLNYSVTASIDGFTATSGSGSVPKNGADTVTIYLTAATAGTKVVKGLVTDSITKAVLANAKVTLTISNGGGAGGGRTSLTFIAATAADGSFLISGIPVDRNTGSVSVVMSGYLQYSRNNTALGAANTADTTTINIALRLTSAPVLKGKSDAHSQVAFSISESGLIHINSLSHSGVVQLFGIDGKLICKKTVGANSNVIKIPSRFISGKPLVLSIQQDDKVFTKQIIVP